MILGSWKYWKKRIQIHRFHPSSFKSVFDFLNDVSDWLRLSHQQVSILGLMFVLDKELDLTIPGGKGLGSDADFICAFHNLMR